MAQFDVIYQNILKDVMENGIREPNKRHRNEEVAALPGVHFSLDLEKDGLPILTLRKIPLKFFIAEQVWFIAGARKPDDFLKYYTKVWNWFTNPGGVVTVAYGYRWRKHFGRDQLLELINLLKKDPSSRHGVIVTWDPASDGLTGVPKMNVPCPYTFTVNIIGGRLNLHNVIRSNDLILGLPMDAAGFALLQCILAEELGVRPGVYSHSISNAHIYENHYEGAKEMIKRDTTHPGIHLEVPKGAFARAEKKDHALVEEIAAELEAQYQPQAAIKNLTISV